MKHIIIISIFLLSSCSTHKKTQIKYSKTFIDEVNLSIIDGFFDGDTAKVQKNTYFLKN